jgi:hypothetical protein
MLHSPLPYFMISERKEEKEMATKKKTTKTAKNKKLSKAKPLQHTKPLSAFIKIKGTY